MKVSEPIEIQIDRLAVDGCGYSNDNQYAVFGALDGETVVAAPLSRKKKQLYLKATDILVPSDERVQPRCAAAGDCGGCSFQHFDHGGQLRLKHDLLRSELSPMEPEEWLPPLKGESIYRYRTKARLGVKFVDKKNRVLIGFREKQKPYITDITCCPVLGGSLGDLIAPLESLIEGLSITRSVPQIEIAAGDADSAMVIRHLEPMNEADLVLLEEFGLAHDIQVYLQPGGLDSVHQIYPKESSGFLHYALPEYGLNFKFAPMDFTQVNLEVNRLMVQRAISLLDLNPGDRVLDAFCGIGNFSLAVAGFVDRVVAAEQSIESIRRARMNAAENGVNNVQFETVDLHEESPEIPGFTGLNKVLLDPPRSGALALMKKLASSDVEKVVYVSCNPETLARDVKYLTQQGFVLRSAGIIDMFPHTTHVESVALLSRQEQRLESAV